jgi:hypothetical protein
LDVLTDNSWRSWTSVTPGTVNRRSRTLDALIPSGTAFSNMTMLPRNRPQVLKKRIATITKMTNGSIEAQTGMHDHQPCDDNARRDRRVRQMIGDRSSPNAGQRTPAATGTPAAL